MPKVLIEDKVLNGVFTIDGTPVSPELRKQLVEVEQWTVIQQDHPFWRDAILHRNGSAAGYLYGQRAAGQ